MTDLLDLYHLSLNLLPCGDPDEVVHSSLDVLRQRTKASICRIPLGRPTTAR